MNRECGWWEYRIAFLKREHFLFCNYIMSLENLLSTTNPQLLRFIKNEKWERKPQIITTDDAQILSKEKNIGIIAVPHMGSVTKALLENLSAHTADLTEIIVLDKTQLSESCIHEFGPIMQELYEFKRPLIEEISQVFLELVSKPYKEKHTANFHKHYTPKRMGNQSKPIKKHFQRRKH